MNGVKRSVKGKFVLKPKLDGSKGALNGFIELEICFPGIGRIYFEGEMEGFNHTGNRPTMKRYVQGTIKAENVIKIVPIRKERAYDSKVVGIGRVEGDQEGWALSNNDRQERGEEPRTVFRFIARSSG